MPVGISEGLEERHVSGQSPGSRDGCLFAELGKCPIWGILNITFKYLLKISPIFG
jgi:hypothetical protein